MRQLGYPESMLATLQAGPLLPTLKCRFAASKRHTLAGLDHRTWWGSL